MKNTPIDPIKDLRSCGTRCLSSLHVYKMKESRVQLSYLTARRLRVMRVESNDLRQAASVQIDNRGSTKTRDSNNDHSRRSRPRKRGQLRADCQPLQGGPNNPRP